MSSSHRRVAAVVLLSMAILNLGFVSTAQAGIVDTSAMVSTNRDTQLSAIQAQLHRADVRDMLVKMGVDEATLEQRIATLSDSELTAISEQMQQAPAGGILAIIGATFVVLLILEMTGVIDIFKRVPAR